MELTVNVTKKLEGFSLDVSFSSEAKTLVLYGPSGAGKSLTLRALAGLFKPDSGAITLGGKCLYDSGRGIDTPARKRKVGYVFQDYALFPHLTVLGNVLAPLSPGLFRRVAEEERARAEELLSSLELTPLKDRRVGELSGGQRQRTALARALAAKPELLLLDEPFSALDRDLRQKMRQVVRSLGKTWKVPCVLVTHDSDDVEALADEVVVMDRGRVVRTWPLRAICRKRRVAGFVSTHGPLTPLPRAAP